MKIVITVKPAIKDLIFFKSSTVLAYFTYISAAISETAQPTGGWRESLRDTSMCLVGHHIKYSYHTHREFYFYVYIYYPAHTYIKHSPVGYAKCEGLQNKNNSLKQTKTTNDISILLGPTIQF